MQDKPNSSQKNNQKEHMKLLSSIVPPLSELAGKRECKGVNKMKLVKRTLLLLKEQLRLKENYQILKKGRTINNIKSFSRSRFTLKGRSVRDSTKKKVNNKYLRIKPQIHKAIENIYRTTEMKQVPYTHSPKKLSKSILTVNHFLPSKQAKLILSVHKESEFYIKREYPNRLGMYRQDKGQDSKSMISDYSIKKTKKTSDKSMKKNCLKTQNNINIINSNINSLNRLASDSNIQVRRPPHKIESGKTKKKNSGNRTIKSNYSLRVLNSDGLICNPTEKAKDRELNTICSEITEESNISGNSKTKNPPSQTKSKKLSTPRVNLPVLLNRDSVSSDLIIQKNVSHKEKSVDNLSAHISNATLPRKQTHSPFKYERRKKRKSLLTGTPFYVSEDIPFKITLKSCQRDRLQETFSQKNISKHKRKVKEEALNYNLLSEAMKEKSEQAKKNREKEREFRKKNPYPVSMDFNTDNRRKEVYRGTGREISEKEIKYSNLEFAGTGRMKNKKTMEDTSKKLNNDSFSNDSVSESSKVLMINRQIEEKAKNNNPQLNILKLFQNKV